MVFGTTLNCHVMRSKKMQFPGGICFMKVLNCFLLDSPATLRRVASVCPGTLCCTVRWVYVDMLPLFVLSPFHIHWSLFRYISEIVNCFKLSPYYCKELIVKDTSCLGTLNRLEWDGRKKTGKRMKSIRGQLGGIGTRICLSSWTRFNHINPCQCYMDLFWGSANVLRVRQTHPGKHICLFCQFGGTYTQ